MYAGTMRSLPDVTIRSKTIAYGACVCVTGRSIVDLSSRLLFPESRKHWRRSLVLASSMRIPRHT